MATSEDLSLVNERIGDRTIRKLVDIFGDCHLERSASFLQREITSPSMSEITITGRIKSDRL
jgi:hypothetical protein